MPLSSSNSPERRPPSTSCNREKVAPLETFGLNTLGSATLAALSYLWAVCSRRGTLKEHFCCLRGSPRQRYRLRLQLGSFCLRNAAEFWVQGKAVLNLGVPNCDCNYFEVADEWKYTDWCQIKEGKPIRHAYICWRKRGELICGSQIFRFFHTCSRCSEPICIFPFGSFCLCSRCFHKAGQATHPGSSSRPEVAASCFEWWDSIMTRTAAKWVTG